MQEICAVIPALNEAPRIAAVIRGVRRQGIDVIVVDDGSGDGTEAVARAEGAAVVRHPSNRGKGAALRTGFDHVLGKGYRSIVTLDGDGQHDPAEISRFLDTAERTGADIIVGSRMHSLRGMPWTRILCNRVGSAIVSRVCGVRIPDALIGYRLMKTDVLRSITLEADRYEIDPEILLKGVLAGRTVQHVDVTCIYGNERSRIRPLRDGLLFFRLVGRLPGKGGRS